MIVDLPQIDDPGQGALPFGARIGRYEIHELLRRDSTGWLYHAHDPQLARDVALKVIAASPRPDRTGEAADRSLFQAQRLAQLSHPNVVTTFDVGTHAGAVFIVTELVQGITLEEWASHERPPADVLRVLIAAGRGLVAAHAAGIGHGSFEPSSVVVSSDGRVRVMDFGLVSLDDSSAWAFAATERDAGESAEPSDARDDQFSYALTACLALSSCEPNAVAREARAAKGRRPAGPWPRAVSQRVRRVIDRGMAHRSSQRYPSLGAMVRALERAAAPARTRALGWGVTTLALVGSAVAGVRWSSVHRPLCELDDSAFHGIWDADRREAVARAFRATGRGNAAETFQLLADRLDAFEKEWLEIRDRSCEATQIRQEQPERVFALRAVCLDRSLAGLRALVEALTAVEASTLDGVAGALPPPLTPCSDLDTLTSTVRFPVDPGVRTQIEAVEREIAVSRELIAAGQGAASIERAERTLELARATKHPPTIALASTQLARVSYAAAHTNEQRAAGEASLKESMRLAADAGDDALLARTAAYLFYVIGQGEGRVQEAEAMLPMVEALVQRTGNRAEQQVQLLMGQEALLAQHSKFSEQIQVLERAMQVSETGGPELAPYAISAAIDLGRTYSALGRHREAVQASERAVDGVRRLYGPSHPRLIFALADLARSQSMAGHLDAALAALAEMHRLAPKMRSDEPRLKYIPYAEGDVWMNSGNCARAVPFFRQAVEQFTAANGPEHTLTTDILEELGTCLASTQQVSEAVSVLERALANRHKAGDTPSSTAQTEFELAKALWAEPAQRPRARSLTEEARELYSREGANQTASELEGWLAAHRAPEPNRLGRQSRAMAGP